MANVEGFFGGTALRSFLAAALVVAIGAGSAELSHGMSEGWREYLHSVSEVAQIEMRALIGIGAASSLIWFLIWGPRLRAG